DCLVDRHHRGRLLAAVLAGLRGKRRSRLRPQDLADDERDLQRHRVRVPRGGLRRHPEEADSDAQASHAVRRGGLDAVSDFVCHLPLAGAIDALRRRRRVALRVLLLLDHAHRAGGSRRAAGAVYAVLGLAHGSAETPAHRPLGAAGLAVRQRYRHHCLPADSAVLLTAAVPRRSAPLGAPNSGCLTAPRGGLQPAVLFLRTPAAHEVSAPAAHKALPPAPILLAGGSAHAHRLLPRPDSLHYGAFLPAR